MQQSITPQDKNPGPQNHPVKPALTPSWPPLGEVKIRGMNDSLVALTFISSMAHGDAYIPAFPHGREARDTEKRRGDEEVSNHNHFSMQICTSVGGYLCRIAS